MPRRRVLAADISLRTAPSARARSASPASRSMAAANELGDAGSTTRPVSSWRTNSGGPPRFVTIIALARA